MLQKYNFSINPQGDGENSITTNCHYLFVLHELPLMYHELSLIVWGVLHQGADGFSSHVMPTLTCALAGICGCCLSLSSVLLWKPDIAYRGVIGSSFQDFVSYPSLKRINNTRAPCRHRGHRPAISYTARGLSPCHRFASSRGTKRSIYDRFM